MASSTYEKLSLSKILSKKTAVELRKMARGFYVRGSSAMRKEALVSSVFSALLVPERLEELLPVVQNVERKMVTNFSVFIIQFPYGLLGTLKEHFYDFFIINHRATSFLVSPIYYGFSRQY